jgi:hypothetical protein
MGYLVLEVEIDHGRIVAREPGKLPEKGRGVLTVTESDDGADEIRKLDPLEAFHELQKSLKLDDAKAKAWMDAARDARR